MGDYSSMKKKSKVIASIATAVIGTGIATNSVSADEIVDNAVATPSTKVKTEAPVTAEAVASSQTNLDQATQAVTDQTAVVKDAQDGVDTATENVTTAQADVDHAEQLVADASPETIATAEQSVGDQATIISDAKEAVTTAEATQTEKETAVENQETVVAEKQSTVDNAQKSVDSTQKSVDNAQAVLDGTGQAETIVEAERAQLALAESEAEVTLREGELAVAKENDRNAQIRLTGMETSVRNDQVDVTETKNTLDQASAKVAETTETVKTETADVTTAKAVLDGLNSEIANHNTITLPAGYVEELRRFYLAKVAERDNTTLTNVAKSGLTLNTYKSNEKDKATVISDVDNLTEDQRNELTLYTVDLINQIRQSFGTDSVLANETAIAFANEVANTSAKTGDEAMGHDTTAIPTAAGNYGLVSNMGVNNYENWSAGHFQVSPTLTMNDIKKGIYTTVVNMMFDDGSTWGHATSLAGIRGTMRGQVDSKYIGVDVSSAQFSGFNMGRVHILGVADSQIVDTTKFDETANIPERDLQAELAQAQTNLDKETADLTLATTANNEAKALELSAKQDYDMAVAELNRDQSELTRLQNRVAETPQAITNYANAVAKRDTDKAINDKAQEALATLKADVKTKQEALANAKSNLVEKQNQLAIAKSDLSKEQSVLENLASSLREAEATVKEKEAVLAQAEVKAVELAQYVEDLKNAPKVLAEAQAKLAEAEKVLAEKLNILEAEQAKLKTLEAVQADVSAQHAKIVEAYKAVVKAQEEARKLAEEKKQLEDKVVVRENDSDSTRSVEFLTQKLVIKKQSGDEVYAGYEKSYYGMTAPKNNGNFYKGDSKSLPKTGEETSMLSIFGLLGLVLGLIGLQRKKY